MLYSDMWGCTRPFRASFVVTLHRQFFQRERKRKLRQFRRRQHVGRWVGCARLAEEKEVQSTNNASELHSYFYTLIAERLNLQVRYRIKFPAKSTPTWDNLCSYLSRFSICIKVHLSSIRVHSSRMNTLTCNMTTINCILLSNTLVVLLCVLLLCGLC